MSDLRQILSQGKKRIGLLIGAGAPTAIKLDESGKIAPEGKALIPDVAGLTSAVLGKLAPEDQRVVELVVQDLKDSKNIEAILTQVRRLSQSIGRAQVHERDGAGYEELGRRICKLIGAEVGPSLPNEPNPFSELVAWISGTTRHHAVEIFTPNYDLLLEEAFERARVAYFDGFTGAHSPFFNPVSVATCQQLPSRWSLLWKLHGSLGWEIARGAVVRTGSRESTELIYPDHLKYDAITRLPYSALFERLRAFLKTPDSLLVCSGFSFFDSHICAVLDEALAENAHTSVLAFQFRLLAEEELAARMAFRRPNLSLYAQDGAVVNGVEGRWSLGEPPSLEWIEIRKTFWQFGAAGAPPRFILGDFAQLARFFALAQAQRLLMAARSESEPAQAAPEGPITPASTNAQP